MGLEGPYLPPRRSRGGKSAPKDPISPREPGENRGFKALISDFFNDKKDEQITFFDFEPFLLTLPLQDCRCHPEALLLPPATPPLQPRPLPWLPRGMYYEPSISSPVK